VSKTFCVERAPAMAEVQGRRIAGEVHAYELIHREYGRRGPNWYGVTPNGLLCTLTNHTVVGHEDGTISVSPSIAVEGTTIDGKTARWHGFLICGVWTE
jgi:hypothetical protein